MPVRAETLLQSNTESRAALIFFLFWGGLGERKWRGLSSVRATEAGVSLLLWDVVGWFELREVKGREVKTVGSFL